VVTFLIKFCVKFKYILGAEFDTIPTPLATVFQDMDLATGYLDFSKIKWNSPKCHYPFPIPGKKALLLISRIWHYIPGSEHVKQKILNKP